MRRKTTEEYLEAIFVLEKREGRARTGRLAARLGVKPPSVTEMVRKLEEEGLVTHESYAGVHLTAAGKRLARTLMHRHRLLADFFEIIGVEREQAEVDACEIEHHVSPRTMAQLERFVHFVQDAPHEPAWVERFKRFSARGRRECQKD